MAVNSIILNWVGCRAMALGNICLSEGQWLHHPQMHHGLSPALQEETLRGHQTFVQHIFLYSTYT